MSILSDDVPSFATAKREETDFLLKDAAASTPLADAPDQVEIQPLK